MTPDGSSGRVVSSLVNGAEKLGSIRQRVSLKDLSKGVTWAYLYVRKITLGKIARVR